MDSQSAEQGASPCTTANLWPCDLIENSTSSRLKSEGFVGASPITATIMPYIKQEDRERFSCHLGQLIRSMSSGHEWTAGELNYIISSVVWELFHQRPNYQTANDIIGALEGSKLEFYRRIVAPYEDKKMQENGDV